MLVIAFIVAFVHLLVAVVVSFHMAFYGARLVRADGSQTVLPLIGLVTFCVLSVLTAAQVLF